MKHKSLAMLAAAIALGCAGCGTRADNYPLVADQRNDDRRSEGPARRHLLRA
jgi:hypothetical protein